MLEKTFGFTTAKNNICWEGSTDPDPGKSFALYIQYGDLHASVVCAEMLLRRDHVYPIYTAGMVKNCFFKGITPFYYRDEPMIPIFTQKEYYRRTDGDYRIRLRDISQIFGPLADESNKFGGVIINPHTDGLFLRRDYALELLMQSLYPPKYLRPAKGKHI